MRLKLLVFVSGLCVMAVEMTGLRLLAPFFGTSLLVTTVLITSMMIFLSAGYWIGGKQADKHPSLRSLSTVTLTAGVLVLFIPLAGQPILRAAAAIMRPLVSGKTVDEPTMAIATIVGGILGILGLMAAPVTLMGMVSPWAIRLVGGPPEEVGRAAGRLYALSTLGSIAGSVLPALALVPLLGVRNTFVLVGGLLVLVSAVCRWGPKGLGAAAIWATALLPAGTIRPMDGLVWEQESVYHFIQVVVEPWGKCPKAYHLYLNEGVGVHSVKCIDGTAETRGYWPYLAAVALFRDNPETTKEVLVVGLAGGTVARHVLGAFPEVHVDGVEIDGAVIEVGKAYFDDADPRVTPYVMDGRVFLAATQNRYDVMLIDAYRQPYIPFHLTTVEFWREVSEHLGEDGVVGINVASVKGVSESLGQMIYATMREVFPQVVTVDAGTSNTVLIGLVRPKALDHAVQELELVHAAGLDQIRSTFKKRIQPEVEGWEGARVLTDDQAPVEMSWDLQALAFAG